jgi:hypothetical protein
MDASKIILDFLNPILSRKPVQDLCHDVKTAIENYAALGSRLITINQIKKLYCSK